MAGIAIDAATEELFEKYRGEGGKGPHKWEKYWEVLEWQWKFSEIYGRDSFDCRSWGNPKKKWLKLSIKHTAWC